MRDSCKWIAALSWCVLASWCVAYASAASSTTTSTPTPVATPSVGVKVANESQEAQAQEQVAILKQINRVNNDGSYTYGYEAADGSFKIETRDITGTVKGMFGFLDENGQLKRVTYSASNNTGFQSSPTTSARPAPIYRPHPSTTANPPPVYRTTASSIQAIPRVLATSSIQSIPRVTLPRHRRPGSSTTASPVSRRPVIFVRPPAAQVTETPDEAGRGSTGSPTTEPVLVRKVLVNRRPVVVEQVESPSLEGKLDEDGTTKSGNHQGNALRRQLGAERGYGGLPQQFLRLRQQAGGTDDSGDVYGGAGVGRPIAGSPYRGGFNPNQPRVVQEAILQGQQQGYAPTQRVPLGNFNELDPRIQARILNSVDPRIQARILNSLDPSVRAEIFRSAEADMKLPFGVLQNQLDPTNPSNPNVPLGFRGNLQREDPRLGQGVRGPYINPLNDPRSVAASGDDQRIRGGLNGVDGMFPSRGAYPAVPLRNDNYTGGDPQILQMFLNQQDPRLGVSGYRPDPQYVNAYSQDPQVRGQVPQDPRQIAAYYSRLRGRFNQDPRQGYQDPRIGGSYFQDPRFGGGYSNQDPRLAAGYAQDPRVPAGYQEDSRDAAGYAQDPRVASGYSQDPRVASGYAQDPRVTSGYSQDPRVASGYATGYDQQDDMALRIPLNPRLPFGNPRLRPDSQSDYTLMQQLLQVLLARAQLQRLQQQQQQQQQRTQYRRPSSTLTPFQQALLSTLEPNAPELLEQMMNQLREGGPQQFPGTYAAGDENDPRYQQVYGDAQATPYPTQDGARTPYDQRQFGFQTPQYRRRFRYRPRYMPMPTYQDAGAVQYYQGPQGFTDYQEPQDYAGYQQTQQAPLQQQNVRYVRPTPLQDPQVYSRQPEAYSGTPGSVRSYQDLPPEYREAILLRMILASRSRAQQYQDQTQQILQQSIGASSSVSSTTTPAPTPTRDARTFSPVRNVQILDTTATETNAKRSTEAATATPKK